MSIWSCVQLLTIIFTEICYYEQPQWSLVSDNNFQQTCVLWNIPEIFWLGTSNGEIESKLLKVG